MPEEKNLSKYNFEGGLTSKLQSYKEKFSLNNLQLAMVLGVTTVTISRWLHGTEPRKKISLERLDRLFNLDFFNDDMSQVNKGYNKPSQELKEVSGIITLEEEKNSLEPQYEPSTWSVSRVKTWLDSPWDFYCKYIKGLRKASPWQDALDRGTVLHEYLEMSALYPELTREEIEEKISHVNDNILQWNTLVESGKRVKTKEKNFYKELLPEYLDDIEEEKIITPLSQKGIDDGYRVARKYLDEYGGIDNKGKVLETEKKISWDLSEYLPNQDFVGYIDAIVEDERGNIWLVDYKTYSNKPKFEDLRMELQANVYMYVMKNIYGVDVAGFIYDCINPKEKIVGRGYHFHQFKITYNERIVNMVTENFLTTIEIILNNPEYNIYKESKYGTAFMEELVHGFENQYKIKITGIEEE